MTAALVLLSYLQRHANIALSDRLTAGETATAETKLRDLIAAASEAFTTECQGRRFDRFRGTRYYTPYSLENGGDLLSAYELVLDAELRSVTTITNGDDTSITSGYTLWPRNQDEKWSVKLDRSGTVTWVAPSTGETWGSVEVNGEWGYGGEWISSGDTVQSDPLSSSATSLTVTDADNFEAGMLIKIETEFCNVTAISSSTNVVTIERGYNGSTAGAHVQGTAIYYHRADDLVRRQVARLVQWTLEQNKTPLVGQVAIADFSFPVTVSSMPDDVRRAAAQLRRPLRMVAG